MTTLPGNARMLQQEILDQWYKSCDAGLRSLNQLFDVSHDIIDQLTRQQHTGVDACLDALRGRKQRAGVEAGRAVVTGGTGGIGTAVCRRLAADGNLVVSTCIPAEAEQARAWKSRMTREGYSVDIRVCDVSDFDSCRELAAEVEETYGPVEILVNAAGITRDAMLRKMTPEQWQAVLDTNLDSVFNVTRGFIRGMIANGYGRIVNISSVNGQKGQFGQTNYSTAKAGMIGFTRSLAVELADKGITVNCVCPGYVHTPMVEKIREDVLKAIVDQIPMGRLATVEEIAGAVAFLASRDSGYITGTELAVNGGLWTG